MKRTITDKTLDMIGFAAGGTALLAGYAKVIVSGPYGMAGWFQKYHILGYSLLIFTCWVVCHIGSVVEESFFGDSGDKHLDFKAVFNFSLLYKVIFPFFLFILLMRVLILPR